MPNKTLILTLIITISAFYSNAQNVVCKKSNIKYAEYLLQMNLDSDFVYLMKDIAMDDNYPLKKDSIDWLKAQYFDKQNNPDSSLVYFSAIKYNSPLYKKSKYWKTFNQFQLGQTNFSDSTLKSDTSSIIGGSFNLAYLLLERNTLLFDVKVNIFKTNEQTHFIELNEEIKLHRNKSGVLAGVLSTAIPGLGKVYAGQKYEGISTFFPVVFLGAQFLEAIKKAHSLSDPRLIISGAFFSVFYIGNIWGSILSVNVVQQEFDKKINNEILFTLRMSMDNMHW